MVTPVTVLWAQKAPTLISHLPADWRSTVFYQLCNVSMFPSCLCVCRCGTTLWPRQLRTGLMPACGSTGHLTSSGSWVKTSPSGQDGKWPLTSLPLFSTSAASLKDGSLSQQSWLLPCSSLLLSLKILCTVTWWLLEECSCDPSDKQKLCFQPWPMRTKAHPFSGSWFSIWKHRTPSHVLHF